MIRYCGLGEVFYDSENNYLFGRCLMLKSMRLGFNLLPKHITKIYRKYT